VAKKVAKKSTKKVSKRATKPRKAAPDDATKPSAEEPETTGRVRVSITYEFDEADIAALRNDMDVDKDPTVEQIAAHLIKCISDEVDDAHSRLSSVVAAAARRAAD